MCGEGDGFVEVAGAVAVAVSTAFLVAAVAPAMSGHGESVGRSRERSMGVVVRQDEAVVFIRRCGVVDAAWRWCTSGRWSEGNGGRGGVRARNIGSGKAAAAAAARVVFWRLVAVVVGHGAWLGLELAALKRAQNVE